MNYGLYLSAAGALSSMHRQDVLANNLANMNTVGFKPDRVDTRQRLPERLESPDTFASPQLLLERLGGGLLVQPTRIELKQGNLITTDNDLDLALEGPGLFVVGSGYGGDDRDVRFTRDGRFTLNARGELVMAANGMNVLDAGRRPIHLDPASPVRIDPAGTILQNGAAVAQLGVVDAPDPADLVKQGDNLMRLADNAATPPRTASGRVRQGYTESSAVDPVMMMNAMMTAAKAAQGNFRMIQQHDHIIGQTMNTFARVA